MLKKFAFFSFLTTSSLIIPVVVWHVFELVFPSAAVGAKTTPWIAMAFIWTVSYVFYYKKVDVKYLIPFYQKRSWRLIFIVTASTLLFFSLAALIIGLIQGRMPTIRQDYRPLNISAALFIFSFACLEEIIVRGFLMSGVRRFFNTKISVVVVNLIFAALHYPYSLDPLSFFGYFSLGLCYTALCFYANALLPAIIAHAVLNYLIGASRFTEFIDVGHNGLLGFKEDPNNVFSYVQIIVSIFITAMLAQKMQVKVHQANHNQSAP